MGSNISIVNATNHDLHICLKQVCPLYYENYVKPGQFLSRDVGKVWFTIEARVALNNNDSSNEYSSGMNVFQGFLFSGAVIISLLVPTLFATGAAGAIGAIAATNDGGVVWSPNWYMGYNRRVEIRCMVESTCEKADNGSGISEKRVGNGGTLQFYLVEVCPSGCKRESNGVCADCS